MESAIAIRHAGANDYQQVIALLQLENLPVEDIDNNLTHFFVAEENETVIAAAGLEWYGNYALLRSVVTVATHRNRGLAAALLGTIINYAKEKQLEKLYLITNTAEKYFEKEGFQKIERNAVAEEVLQSKEFNGLCPASAVIMVRSL